MNPRNLPGGFREAAEPLRGLAGREASALRKELMDRFGLSRSTLHRYLDAIGIRGWVRGDKQVRRGLVRDEELAAVFKLQQSSHTLDRGLLMPDEVAIDIAVDNGLVRPGVLTVNVYRAWRRGKGISAADLAEPEAHVQLRTLHPNQAWEVDFSVARNWKLKNHRPVYDAMAYKGKELNIGELRIMRFVAVDHYSGAFFVDYFVSRGETVQIFLEGMYHAMAEKTLMNGQSIADKFPFCGVPEYLLIDRGCYARSKVSQGVLERIGVEAIVCQEARAKGSVESLMWLWERNFESSFRVDPFQSIEELRDEARQRAAYINANRVHTRHGRTRRAMWLQINAQGGQLRKIQCDLNTFRQIAMTEPETRRVNGDLTISYLGNTYRVPEDLRYEERIEVRHSIFEYPKVILSKADSEGAAAYVAEPVQYDEAGFPVDAPVIGQSYKSWKESPAERARKEAPLAVNDLARIVARGNDLAKIAPTAMRPRAVEVPLEPPAPEIYERVAAREKVRSLLGRDFTAAERAYLGRWGDAVTDAEIEAALKDFQEGVTARVVQFRL